MTPLWTFNIVSALLLMAAALRWGAMPERLCASALFFMVFGDRLYHLIVHRKTIYWAVDLGHLFIDLVGAAILVGVALQANRVYPIWASAFQLVSLVSHFTREVSANIRVPVYALMNYVPSYAVLLIVTAGLWNHMRRERRYGPYPAWRSSSAPSRATRPKKPPSD